jgi:hypothetical protein
MHFNVKNSKKIFPSCALTSIDAQMYFNMGVYDRRIEIRRFKYVYTSFTNYTSF